MIISPEAFKSIKQKKKKQKKNGAKNTRSGLLGLYVFSPKKLFLLLQLQNHFIVFLKFIFLASLFSILGKANPCI